MRRRSIKKSGVGIAAMAALLATPAFAGPAHAEDYLESKNCLQLNASKLTTGDYEIIALKLAPTAKGDCPSAPDTRITVEGAGLRETNGPSKRPLVKKIAKDKGEVVAKLYRGDQMLSQLRTTL